MNYFYSIQLSASGHNFNYYYRDDFRGVAGFDNSPKPSKPDRIWMYGEMPARMGCHGVDYDDLFFEAYSVKLGRAV